MKCSDDGLTPKTVCTIAFPAAILKLSRAPVWLNQVFHLLADAIQFFFFKNSVFKEVYCNDLSIWITDLRSRALA